MSKQNFRICMYFWNDGKWEVILKIELRPLVSDNKNTKTACAIPEVLRIEFAYNDFRY